MMPPPDPQEAWQEDTSFLAARSLVGETSETTRIGRGPVAEEASTCHTAAREPSAIPLEASRIDEKASTPPDFPRFTLRDADPPGVPVEPQAPMEALEYRVWALEILVDRLIQLVTQEVLGQAVGPHKETP
jgi:hypothetical protein